MRFLTAVILEDIIIGCAFALSSYEEPTTTLIFKKTCLTPCIGHYYYYYHSFIYLLHAL